MLSFSQVYVCIKRMLILRVKVNGEDKLLTFQTCKNQRWCIQETCNSEWWIQRECPWSNAIMSIEDLLEMNIKTD